MVVAEVSEEFTNRSNVEKEATAKTSHYKKNAMNTVNVPNDACPTGMQYHKKLCKVSIGGNGQLAREQNLGAVVLKDGKTHKNQQHSLGSVMEKLVESANFEKLGTVIW